MLPSFSFSRLKYCKTSSNKLVEQNKARRNVFHSTLALHIRFPYNHTNIYTVHVVVEVQSNNQN